MIIEEKNIILIGMPGCGKSTIGRGLAEKINKSFIDMDEFIEQQENRKISDIFTMGEHVFRNIESKAVESLSKENNLIIATGGGVIKKASNIDNLKKNGIIIFIDRPINKILEDLEDENRPLLKNNKDKIYTLFEERYDLYNKYCDIKVLNEGSLDETLNKLVNILGE
jgi:Shikimate kinase